ncbi:DUF5811 family protein [Halovivax gelatinilyticus]|uniref:DUF5811 family protein n=1 Tax=Halovivax gelatinilyticus TaxID=2961597 RepID=UPI0020CA5CC3|nr:DUF5811 family protein [Halovivax gelatinilyticus]
MNGNTPYAGRPGTTQAGHRSVDDVEEVTPGQRRVLRRDVSRVAARTRDFLPDEYVVDSDISQGVAGPQVTVAVQPPIGHPVSAGFAPDLEPVEEADSVIDDDECDEVARGLAASAALQVKQAMGDDITPTAR